MSDLLVSRIAAFNPAKDRNLGVDQTYDALGAANPLAYGPPCTANPANLRRDMLDTLRGTGAMQGKITVNDACAAWRGYEAVDVRQ